MELRRRLSGVRHERDTLRDAALVVVRCATDDGARTELDAVIAAFGLTRESLGHELDVERPDAGPDPAGPA